VIFDESYAPASSNLLDLAAFTATYGAAASALPAVTSGRVVAFNNRLSKSGAGTVASDWFETSVARPDLVSWRVGHVGRTRGGGGAGRAREARTRQFTSLPEHTPNHTHTHRSSQILSRSSLPQRHPRAPPRSPGCAACPPAA
jgi:hypothetical protein